MLHLTCMRAKSFQYAQFFVNLWTVACQAPLSMGFSRQECWGGLPFPSPGIFLTRGLNQGLLHCRWILYHLSHRGSPHLGKEHIKFPTFFVSTSIPNLTRMLDGVTTVHVASLHKAASDVATYLQHI